jgi:uncharacterized protein YbjQ (UPF0145 family)
MKSRQLVSIALFCGLVWGCTTVPEPKMDRHEFPTTRASLERPAREYEDLGRVTAKVNYASLTSRYEEKTLCNNAFNQAVNKLVERARAKGGDAVVEVRSVVFMVDGTSKTYKTAECADDGAEGQALVQGQAVKFR